MLSKNNQCGRSMIVMIGVLLAIIYIGHKASHKIHQYRIFTQASSITAQAKILACDFDEHKYRSYAEMLYEKNRIPSGLQYANDKFQGIDGISYRFIENTKEWFTLEISNLNNRNCTDIVTSQWFGGKNTVGFHSIFIEDSGPYDIITELGARAFCTNHNDGIVKIRFLGCEKK